jgi:maltooligosyltrehalose trehalohydrolase
MNDDIYPTVGAFYNTDNTCTFTVWAPLKKDVALLLKDAAYPMKQDGLGFWNMMLEGVKPGDRYQFRIDNDKTFPDPASRCQPEGVHAASAVTETSFAWTDDHWKGLPLKDMILYELHTGTFTQAGNFDGVVSKLNYLQQLGINAIELLPVVQFPGNRNWGYDGVYPFAVHTAYGGIDGLKQLVNEAHRRGIAVVLDVVYNHLGPEGNYFSAFGPWFTDKYKTPWGTAINFDDAWCDGVRHYYWQNALMWLDEFHIDALRLDAVHAIWDSGANHFIKELKKKVTQLEIRTGRKKVLIAEFDLNNPQYIYPADKGGYNLDGQWIDEFHHALHTLVTGEVNGYYEDFGTIEHLARSLKDSYVYTGQYSVHRKKHFGAPPHEAPCYQFVVFAQNHDQIGNRLAGDRLTTQLSTEGLKLTAATVLLSPHVPLLFMGEEYGEKNPFQYFISHTDKELVEMTRKGRREEFAYFNWEGDIPDPESEETFRQCILSWNYEQDRTAASLLAFYRHLIAFRKTRAAMQAMERKDIRVLPVMDQVIGFERMGASDHLLVLLNFATKVTWCTPQITGAFRKIFDSSDARWNGPGAITPTTIYPGQPVHMNPQSAVIFELYNAS